MAEISGSLAYTPTSHQHDASKTLSDVQLKRINDGYLCNEHPTVRMKIPGEKAVYKKNFLGSKTLISAAVKEKVNYESCPECAKDKVAKEAKEAREAKVSDVSVKLSSSEVTMEVSIWLRNLMLKPEDHEAVGAYLCEEAGLTNDVTELIGQTKYIEGAMAMLKGVEREKFMNLVNSLGDGKVSAQTSGEVPVVRTEEGVEGFWAKVKEKAGDLSRIPLRYIPIEGSGIREHLVHIGDLSDIPLR